MSKHDNSSNGAEFWAAQASTGKYKKPKSVIRLSFPPTDETRILNVAEISAPGGMSIALELPFPMPEASLSKIAEAIRNAGGTLEMGGK